MVKANTNAWINCIIASILLFFSFSQMTVFNSIGSELIEAFQINSTQLGQLSSLYLYGLVIFFFPSGYLFDKYPVRTVFLITSLLAIVGTVLFSLSNNFILAAIGRFLTGMMHAAIFTGCLKLASRWLSSSLALATSIIITIGFLGGWVTQAPFFILMQYSNWRIAQMTLIFLAITAIFLFFLRVKREVSEQEINKKIDNEIFDGVKKIVSLNQNWLCSLYITLINFPALLLGALWGNVYLVNAHSITHIQASIVISIFYIGIIIGTPFFGWLSDKIRNRKIIIRLGAFLLLIVSCIPLVLSNLDQKYLMGIFLLMGFFSSVETIGYPIITEINPTKLTASALGFASILVIGIGAIFQSIFGYLVDESNVVNIFEISFNNYQIAFSIIPLSIALGLAISFFIKDVLFTQKNLENL